MRIPSNPIAQALLKELGEPLLTSTLILPDQTEPLDDPYDIENQLGKRIDVFIDGGFGTLSTLVSWIYLEKTQRSYVVGLEM